MIDWRLAHSLIQACAEVNDGNGLTLEVENVACRIYLPDAVDMPDGVPEGSALVVFAGSNDFKDWIKNASIFKKLMPAWGKVHGGFYDCFLKIKHPLEIALQGVESVVIAGHSLGGALAVLSAAHLWQLGLRVPAVYTFGSPRPASEDFRDAYKATGIPTYRVVVGWDCVPRHPDSFEDFHCGKGYFLTGAGVACKEQRNPGWRLWRWIWNAVDNHIAADEYTRAIRVAAQRTSAIHVQTDM